MRRVGSRGSRSTPSKASGRTELIAVPGERKLHFSDCNPSGIRRPPRQPPRTRWHHNVFQQAADLAYPGASPRTPGTALAGRETETSKPIRVRQSRSVGPATNLATQPPHGVELWWPVKENGPGKKRLRRKPNTGSQESHQGRWGRVRIVEATCSGCISLSSSL